jgi:hypothetical protein
MLLAGLRRHQLRDLFESRGMDAREATLKIALLGDLDGWACADLGTEVQLTWDERVALDIRNIDPFDKTPAEFETLKKKRNQEGNNIRAKHYRARAKEKCQREDERVAFASDVDAREDAILAAIPVDDWVSAPRLAVKCGHFECWRGLTGANLKRVLRRVLDRLQAKGLITSAGVEGDRGGRPVRWVKRTPNPTLI